MHHFEVLKYLSSLFSFSLLLFFFIASNYVHDLGFVRLGERRAGLGGKTLASLNVHALFYKLAWSLKWCFLTIITLVAK